MNRGTVLGALIALGGVPIALGAAQAPAGAGQEARRVDANNGGSGLAYADTLMKVHGGVADVQTIITGHGPTMTRADLQEFASFVREFVEAARAAKKAGQSASQFAAAWKVPERFAGYAAAQPARLPANAELIFQEAP